MKRCAFKLVVFLLLGAIVNVAVAWTGNVICLRVPFSEPMLVALQEQVRAGLFRDLTRPRMAFSGACRDIIVLSSYDVDLVQHTQIYDHYCGFPCRSLHGQFLRVTHFAGMAAMTEAPSNVRQSPTPTELSTCRTAMRLPQQLELGQDPNWFVLDKTDSLLPYGVIWPGFAINTLFYAAILWLLFAAPFALRRRRRIKRGLCPACGYPVGDSEVCTECGKPVRRLKAEGLE